MPFHEYNVDAFIKVLIEQRSLFTPEELAALKQLVDSSPDNIEELSQVISEWCEQHPKIYNEQLKYLPDNAGEMAPGSRTGNVPPPTPNKQALLGAIQQSSCQQDVVPPNPKPDNSKRQKKLSFNSILKWLNHKEK